LDALPYAIDLAHDKEAQLTFVNVANAFQMGPVHYGSSTTVAFQHRLEHLLAPAPASFGSPEFVVRHGDSVDRVVRIADSVSAGMIVLSARASSPGPLLLPIGSEVMWRANCPVLVVRKHELGGRCTIKFQSQGFPLR
jgi:nucleotide-binding universal stress UspA family protein